MNIAIPVNGNENNSKVNSSLGRTPYFLIYNTDDQSEKHIPNKAAESPGGAGIIAAQLLIDMGTDVLLTPRCGKNAGQVLEKAGIKIYQSSGTDIKGNIENYVQGKLPEINEFHEGFHQGGK